MSALLSLFLFDGANEACKRALGTSLPSKIICPTAVLCSAMFSSSLQEVTDVALGTFGYVLSAVAILFPIALFAIAKVQKKLRPHLYACLDAEYEHDTQNASNAGQQRGRRVVFSKSKPRSKRRRTMKKLNISSYLMRTKWFVLLTIAISLVVFGRMVETPVCRNPPWYWGSA